MSMTSTRPEPLQRLIDGAYGRHRFHRNAAMTLDRWYRRLAWFLSLYVPLASAAVSALAATLTKELPSAASQLSTWIAALGGTVTVATIVQSALKPEQKYVQYADILVQLEDWRVRFELALATLDGRPDSELVALVEERQLEVSRLGRLMAERHLPPFQRLQQ